MADFQIVTIDDQAYTEGQTSLAFKDLGYDSTRLQAFEYDGDYVVLRYENGLQIGIPEHRIKYIATKTS